MVRKESNKKQQKFSNYMYVVSLIMRRSKADPIISHSFQINRT